MAWQDRPYYRDRSNGPVNPLMWLLTGSIPLGTWFGISVRMHASMIVLLVLTLLFPGAMGGPASAVTFGVILFTIVLLHEFGHCFASRWVGGNPREILLYPLGGLAMADSPHRPWPRFITVLGGPMVNVVICVVTGGILYAMNGAIVPWNPLRFTPLSNFHTVAFYLWWIFTVSYALLLFNLWPIFPLDGGQMLQSLLWVKIGYYKSMKFATITGMIGAVIMAMIGLATGALLLLFVAISGFMTCLSMQRALAAAGPDAFGYSGDETDYSAAYDNSIGRPKRLSKWSLKRAAKRAKKLQQQEAAERVRIDAILAKVSAQGMQSLTWWEKRQLRKATEHQRHRDEEMSHMR